MTKRAHLAMCRFAERQTGHIALDTKWARFIKVPRGVGKSTCITQAYAIQQAMAHPDIAILICNETERGATKFLAAIKAQLTDNAFLRALFPDRIPQNPDKECPKWSETEVILPRESKRQESTFSAIGVGGSITGQHPDIAIVDDMFSDEAMENALIGSFAIFDKINRWVARLIPIVNKTEPWHGILWVGTPWFEDDSYHYIEKAFGYGQEPVEYLMRHAWEEGTVNVRCYVVGDLAVFHRPILENGTSFFPERWTDDVLNKMRATDTLLYNANMMLNPSAPEVVVFKPAWKRYYTWNGTNEVRYRNQELKDCSIRIEDLDVVVSVDPAFTEGGQTSSKQALVATGGTPEGLRLLLKAQATRQSLEGFVTDIVQCCKTMKARKLLLEKAGQQITFIKDVRAALDAESVRVSIEEVPPGGKNKDKRIATLETFFERGQIFGHLDHADFWREYDGFPRGKWKDLLDALAYQPPFWTILGTRGQPKAAQQRADKEVAELYARMGLQRANAGKGDVREDGSKRDF